MWAAFFVVNWGASLWVVWMDLVNLGRDIEFWKPAVWEGSSHLVQFALIPVILAWDSQFPLERGRIKGSLAGHAAFTVPYSLAHVALMVAIRKAAYATQGAHYEFGPLDTELLYEYLKDFRAYAGYLTIIYLYRFGLRRLRGEAQFLSQERDQEDPEPVTDRFLVRKLGREFLVKVEDIDWAQASGNYVNLMVGSRVYPLRETMAGLEGKLVPAGFMRVHRSAIVNLDRVAEIVPFDTGDGEARLVSGVKVPVSRRFRKQLRDQLK
jgi:DNA-binding LytR/AlgR family response regulator